MSKTKIKPLNRGLFLYQFYGVKMARYTKQKYINYLIKRGLSEIEAEKYYIDIHRARRKYQRLKRNENILFVPEYSLSPKHITDYGTFLKRNLRLQEFLSPKFSVNINKEVRQTFLSNLEEIFDTISTREDDLSFSKIAEVVNDLSNAQLRQYFKDNNLYEVLFYATTLESFAHDLNIKASDVYKDLTAIKNGKKL